jgi:hypothetical protein
VRHDYFLILREITTCSIHRATSNN